MEPLENLEKVIKRKDLLRFQHERGKKWNTTETWVGWGGGGASKTEFMKGQMCPFQADYFGYFFGLQRWVDFFHLLPHNQHTFKVKDNFVWTSSDHFLPVLWFFHLLDTRKTKPHVISEMVPTWLLVMLPGICCSPVFRFCNLWNDHCDIFIILFLQTCFANS